MSETGVLMDSSEHMSNDVLEAKLSIVELGISGIVEGLMKENVAPSPADSSFSNTESCKSVHSDTSLQHVISPLSLSPVVLDQGTNLSLISRVCHAESAVQALRDMIQRLSKERDRCRREKLAANERFTKAADAFQMEVLRLKQESDKLQSQTNQALAAKANADAAAQKLQSDLEDACASLSKVETELEMLRADHSKCIRMLSEVKEDLNRERELRASLEQSHKTLTHHIHEMETIIEAEREQVRNLTANCNNLKQDGCLVVEKCSQDQQLLTELHNKYKLLLLEKEKAESLAKTLATDNHQQMVDLQTLEAQYSSLNTQLDDMRKIVIKRQSLHEQLQTENQELRKNLLSVESVMSQKLSDLQNELTKKYELSAVALEMETLRSQLKDAMLDRNIHQQRSAQLQIEIVEMKSQITNLNEQLAQSQDQLQKETDALHRVIEQKEVEKERTMFEKASVVSKMNEMNEKSLSDRSLLEGQIHELKVELQAASGCKRKLEQDNKLLYDELHALKHQQHAYKSIEQSLNEMSQQNTKQAYDNGLLKSTIKHLQSELKTMPAIVAELAQLRKASLATEAKYTQVYAELSASQTLIHRLQSELTQTQLAADHREADFNLAIQSRDAALRDKEQIEADLETTRADSQQETSGLQRQLVECRNENSQLSSTLQTLIASRAAFQSTIESLQSDLADRDCELDRLAHENSQLQCERDCALREAESARTTVASTSDLISSATQPLRREVDRLKTSNAKLLESSTALQKTNDQLNAEQSRLKDEVAKMASLNEKLRAACEVNIDGQAREIKALKDKAENLRLQLLKEKDMSAKLMKTNSRYKYKQQDSPNVEHQQTCKFLRQQVSELENQLKESLELNTSLTIDNERLQQRICQLEGNVQNAAKQMAELEHQRVEYVRKHTEQAKTIGTFMKEISDLKSALQRMNRVQLQPGDSCNETWTHSETAKSFEDLSELGDDELAPNQTSPRSCEFEHSRCSFQPPTDKQRTEDTIKRAKEVVMAGRQAVTLLAGMAAENCQTENDHVRRLTEKLEIERNRCRKLESQMKLTEIHPSVTDRDLCQNSSLKSTLAYFHRCRRHGRALILSVFLWIKELYQWNNNAVTLRHVEKLALEMDLVKRPTTASRTQPAVVSVHGRR